ncbi:MAG: carboxylate--amine ligase [Deltaproteobacteria bacterium]|nr:carboxylate--amine ligase [Deltaproteobacteria bacterium]
MARIYVCGAGGAPSNNFTRSLRESGRRDYLIGASCIPSDLFLADVDERHVVPSAMSGEYRGRLLNLLESARPDFLHPQNDFEVRAISRLRADITALGVKLYLPDAETIETCVDKGMSYEVWDAAGIRVPKTVLLKDESDLKLAFDTLGKTIWLRATEGGGGRGALPTDNYEFARLWVERFKGWGSFTASELLTEKTVTWQSIWHDGELVVAQGRKRRSWNFGNRTLSGVTGITGVAETFSDEKVDRAALDAILAIDKKPHGIFSVDMTCDVSGFPNPTEINIGRFFTTHYFFTKAGLNFPEIYCNIALDGRFPVLAKKMNPLPDGLVWIRGMDREPVLTRVEELEKLERRAR